MRLPSSRRRKRHGEHGLTLIELVATLFLMGLALAAVLKGFSALQLTVGSTTDDANLTRLARQVGDLLRSEGIAYVQCTGPQGQAPTGLTSYQSAVRSAVSTPYIITVTAVNQATGGTHTLSSPSGTSTPLSPINGCSAGPAAGADYGVQQIQYKVASQKNSLSRTVYKRWN